MRHPEHHDHEPPIRESSSSLPRELTDTGQLHVSGSDSGLQYILPIDDLPPTDGDDRRRLPAGMADDDYDDAPPLPRWPEDRWQAGSFEMLGTSDAMRDVFARAASLATARNPMLITGSSGTGKYTLAHLIHAASPYDPEIFIPLHCGKQTPEETRNQLFGKPVPENQPFGTRLFAHVQPVQWVEAQNGMLLLMHIEYLDHDVQEEIVRAARKGFSRGKETVLPGHVRLCFTSMWPYEYLVRFRIISVELEVLLRRNHVHLPMLRDRREDIPALVECFLARHADAEAGRPRRPLADGVLRELAGYDWPGNVRELESACSQALESATGDELQPGDFLAARHAPLRPSDLASHLYADESA
ncbi:MAG: sigma 54-interacting transcriptional regulator [Planctomycetota bacterium]